MSNNTKLLCLFLRAQKINKSSEQGYAMAMVSMVSIIMLSLLAASMTFSNLAKSRTDAFVDGSSVFSVAEAGLNKRAFEFKSKIDAYSGVKDVSALTGSKTLPECFGEGTSSATPGTDYLGCRNYSFKSTNTASNVVGSDGNISLNNEYIAYTAISKNDPQLVSISDGDYRGLNALEYKYVLHSTAKRPVDSKGTVLATPTADETAARAKDSATRTPAEVALVAAYDARAATAATETATARAGQSSSNIDLSMTFTNRVISLFQFAIFYNGDLEFNSTTPMTVNGWVHSNANIYVQPAGETAALSANSVTTFLSKVSAVGSIYNRLDAWTPGIGRTGITKVLLTGNDCITASNCQQISDYATGTTTPLTTTEIDTFQKKLAAGIPTLTTPSPGFPRKRNYATNAIGEYYAKADMRLDFMPNRGTTQGVIPFNFTAVTTGGTGTCSTTLPLAGSDPAANYVDPKREGLSTLKCNKLTKGQLQSLRQPVLVLTKLNQTTALATQESTTLNRPTLPTITTTPNTLSTSNNTEANKNKILRALQVALVSTPVPISLDQLNTSFLVVDSTNPVLNSFKTEFSRQLDIIFPDTATSAATQDANNRSDKTLLKSISPNQIAALQNAWFLPAPIQRVGTRTVQDAANNPTGSGFYDGREQRWISVLQTNIASLAVWNRDGLYVEASDNTTDLLRQAAYATTTALKDTAFKNANTRDLLVTNAIGTTSEIILDSATTKASPDPSTQYFTSGLAFDRATTTAVAAATPAITARGLQPLGLGSIDSTEGGLIFHASVNDNLSGDGSTTATNNITKDTANPIYKKNPDNTDYLDLSLPAATVDKRVIIDYYRKYPGVTPIKQSPFAFAFTGGNYLPNNLMLTSDQAIYVQGNFNNNGGINLDATTVTAAIPSSDARLSASIVADTITVLSNECILTTVSPLGVPVGQLSCGVQGGSNLVSNPMTINAAFLSNTDTSNGNLGTGRGYVAGNTTGNKYSGGVNNYIRLLENWNNGGTGNPWALNYMGSMISLGAPLEYSGQYRPGGDVASAAGVTPVVIASYYNVPFRNFSYDPYFNSVDKMPPLTPKASYVQQKNFSRAY
jgi:hypothetical protein